MSESIDDEYDDYDNYVSDRPPWSTVLGLFLLITVAASAFAFYLYVGESDERAPTDAPVVGVDMEALNRQFDEMDARMGRHVEQNQRMLDNFSP